jgi:chromosome segregation ATPase
MSANLKEVFGLIESLENSLDGYKQFFEKTQETLNLDLRSAWKSMQDEQKEIENLETVIRSQNSELTELKLKSDELDKRIEELD